MYFDVKEIVDEKDPFMYVPDVAFFPHNRKICFIPTPLTMYNP